MIKERLFLFKLMVYFLKNKRFDDLKKILIRIKREGKLKIIKNNINLIKKLFIYEIGYKSLNIETAFENKKKEIEKIISKIYKNKNKIFIERLAINPSLILGFIIRENNKKEIDYSLRSIIQKIKDKWMI